MLKQEKLTPSENAPNLIGTFPKDKSHGMLRSDDKNKDDASPEKNDIIYALRYIKTKIYGVPPDEEKISGALWKRKQKIYVLPTYRILSIDIALSLIRLLV